MAFKVLVVLVVTTVFGLAQTVNQPLLEQSNSTNLPHSQAEAAKAAQHSEEVRNACIESRRYIAGRVIQVTPDGLVVDSGYSQLLTPPYNKSWGVRGTVAVDRDAHAVEEKKPDAVCIGLVLLTDIPKRPSVRNYDYVVIHGYPAGEHQYAPVPGVQKAIRRFCGGLERAVQVNLEHERK